MKPIKSFRHIALFSMSALLLSACSQQTYPEDIQLELRTYCKTGIESGLIEVQRQEGKNLSAKDIDRLCTFRVKEFMKEVSLQQYLDLNQHIYENFQRAYQNKYVLKDVYETLSPNDKKINSLVAKIIFGLEPNDAH